VSPARCHAWIVRGVSDAAVLLTPITWLLLFFTCTHVWLRVVLGALVVADVGRIGEPT
jgi:hypothetical protein